MTGLEKIIADIETESGKEVSRITDEAENKVESVMEEARHKAEKECEILHAANVTQTEDILARAKSTAELNNKKTLLETRQELIAACIAGALKEAESRPAQEYFDSLMKMAALSAHEGEGSICFGKKDLERLPADFEQKLNAAIKCEGASLKVSEKCADIDSGFILRYGGIEENCSLAAIFAARHEEFQDIANKVLFA